MKKNIDKAIKQFTSFIQYVIQASGYSTAK